MGFPTNNFPQTPPLGSNGQTPALIADKVLSYPSQNGLPASGPGGVASLTTVDVGGVITPCSAALELQSTTGAFVMPRMTAAQRAALVATNGMEVYEIDTAAVWWFLNDDWVQVDTGGGGGGSVDGPGSSTINAIAIWEVTTGDRIGDSKVLLTVNGNDGTADDLTHVGTILASKTAGVAATPNYSFIGDANTGMWSSAAETIDFSTSGVRQFQIINTGSADDWITITGSSGGAPIIGVSGSDSVIDVLVKTKGTGSSLAISGDGASTNTGQISLFNTNNSNAIGLKVTSGLATSFVLTLPTTLPGSANVPLVGDTSGNLTFSAVDLDNVVVGPASADDNAIARFDTTTGKLIQNSAAIVSDTTGTITLAANGQFIADVGTAAAPAFTFLGDTNSGIYRTSAEHIGFTANGELQFIIQDGAGTVINTLFYQGGATTVDPNFGINTTTDANVDIAFASKGTGGLLVNATSGTATAGALKLSTLGNANFVGFQAPATLAGNQLWTLPQADGTAGQVLSTNGSATLGWSSSIQTVSGTISAAAAQGASVTPVVLVGAVAANTVILIQRVSFEFVGATPFAGAGNFVVQYGHTATGAGPSACGAVLNASFVSLGASTILFSNPTVASIVVSTASDADVCFSATTSFTGGGAINYNVEYLVMTTT